jgi:hypothetical protein
METLRSFKIRVGLPNEKIRFYESTNKSGRFVGSLGIYTLTTTKDFNPEAEVFVCRPPKDFECDDTLYFLTNKSSEGAFTL